MATKTVSKIRTGLVKNGLKQTVTASALLQTYYTVIEKTPLFSIPARVDTDSNSTISKDWPKYQQAALQNAKSYMDVGGINDQITDTLHDIIGFGNKWDHFYKRLHNIATDIQNYYDLDNPTAADHEKLAKNKKMFQGAMTIFKRMTDSAGKSVDPIVAALKDFLNKIEQDERNFSKAHQLVTLALGGEQGEIAELEKTIDSLHKAINKDRGMIAGGAAMIVTGIVVGFVGVAAEGLSFGASTAVVAGGIALAAGGAALAAEAGKNLSKSEDELSADNKKEAEDKNTFANVSNINKNIAGMKDAVNSAILAITNLQSGWISLGADFKTTSDALNSSDISDAELGWLTSDLEAANADWMDTLKQAKALQNNGIVKIQTHITKPNIKAKAA